MKYILILIFIAGLLQGCVGFFIGQAADAAIETAKIPFKVGGAVIDVVSGEDKDKKED